MLKSGICMPVIFLFAGSVQAFDCLQTSSISFTRADFVMSTTGEFTNVQSLASAFGTASTLFTSSCGTNCTDIDLDIGSTFASASASSCTGSFFQASGGGVASVNISSSLISGFVTAGGMQFADSGPDCSCPHIGLASGGAGLDLSFDVSGEFSFAAVITGPAPGFLNPDVYYTSAVFHHFGNGSTIYGATIGGFGAVQTVESDPATLPAGSYSIDSFSLVISDSSDDVTGDGRFNQNDVDFLSSLVGTPAATDPAYERFDYINDPSTLLDDGIQSGEIARLQCFVDAGLSSGFVGDANQDGALNCDDIAYALLQPFAGEAFPAADYKVELDADFDGDNDAADREAVACALLEVEPANLVFDGSLDFFDVSEFLSLYGVADPKADMNSDGNFDFFDVSLFLSLYGTPNCLVAPAP